MKRRFEALKHHVAELGDLFMFDFAPSRGDETPDTHPGCIVTPREYNVNGMAVVVPISHSHLNNPFRVAIPDTLGLGYDGFAHPDRLRSLAYRERKGVKIGTMDPDLLIQIQARIRDLLIP